MKVKASREYRNKQEFSGAFQPGLVDFNHRSEKRNFGAYEAATFRLPSVRASRPSLLPVRLISNSNFRQSIPQRISRKS